jgi:anti-sigma regulatory factor (Ser/Thr protein kinase)
MMTANPAGADASPDVCARGLWWLRVFPGVSVQVAEARQFVAFLLEGCLARDALVSCVSELAANAVIHTASGNGGYFTVEVSYPRSGVARVSVTDEGGPTEPAAGAPVTNGIGDGEIDDLPTCGLGLALVAGAASRWGYTDAGSGRTVWAEVCWPVPVASETPAVSRQPWYTAERGWRDGGGAA